MQYRLILWREEREDSEGPLWEEISTKPFPRFEQGDLIAAIQSLPKKPDEIFVVSRVEYRFEGIGPERQASQNIYFKIQLGGLSN
ncbi:hypothetical protein [Luteolibacter luteus]|uniref:Uncharacterized protein n=1 Tax=Luteolibacter luteus TaxID=2728835 RepID=A0A858RD60_9BACT|nr:hypothetical protein [Luteolibacter luteus]QJE94329.1 hypothetical protein HHL09_00515 [Luteolibacter luteus]